jgi:ABC-type bacteriocin/lantibiotic exporter with double-glycine peptidase domain
VSPSPSSGIVLRDINAKFPQGSITALVGLLGCGKSTLIKAVSGELSCSEGSVSKASGSIGFCSQQPWLPNTTVRRAICGASPYDETWYRTVMSACALGEDLQDLKIRDEESIGSQGISLSGGQKQRLVCVVSSCEILCTDIVLGIGQGSVCSNKSTFTR